MVDRIKGKQKLREWVSKSEQLTTLIATRSATKVEEIKHCIKTLKHKK